MNVETILREGAGTIGYLVAIFGAELIGRGKPLGWKLSVLGNVIWALIGAYLGFWSMVFWSSAWGIANVRGLLRARAAQQ